MRTRLALLPVSAFTVLFLASLLITLRPVAALGTAADLMCASCQMDPTKPMYCPTVPCMDVTNGFTTGGTCIMPGKCLAQSTGGGGITQISQLLGTIGQLLQSLGQGGGGGGSSGGATGCTTYTQTSDPNLADPCSYYVPSYSSSTGSQFLNNTTNADTGSSAVSDLLSSLTGSNNSNTNTDSNPNSINSTSSSADTAGNTSGTPSPNPSSPVLATISNPQDLAPGTSASVSQNAFGSAPGITGDIQVLSGNRVTMLASNRDVSGNRQTSGFFGFGTTIGEATHDIYVQVCSARQWADNFLATIIPVSYLDNLCTSHGYSIIPPTLQPATPPPAPLASPAPKAASTPAYLGPLKADIWVSPATITSGSRTSLFWSASGVLSCKISSPSGVLGSALSGSAAVGPLTQDTTYSIACQSATSSVSNQATVTVQ